MWVAWIAASALAGTVEGGMQAAFFADGVGFVEDRLSGLDLSFEEDRVSAAVDCYDEVGVRDFNLEVPVRSVALGMSGEGLAVDVDFGEIHGEDMVVYGLDSDYLDSCVEFEGDLEYLSLVNGHLSLTLAPVVEDGGLGLEVVGTPVVEGELDTDIAWFPDDLVLAWFEEEIFAALADAVAASVPELAREYLGDALLDGQDYGDWSVGLALDDVAIDPSRLALGITPDVAWTGEDGCPDTSRTGGDPGRTPTLAFEAADGSSLAVGVTEAMLNELFQEAWRQGYFCFTEDNLAEFVDTVQDWFDPEVGDLRATVGLGEPPRVTVEADGIAAEFGDVEIHLTGEVDGARTEVVALRGDVSGVIDVGVDAGISSLTLSVRDLAFAIDELEADHLLSDDEDAEVELRHFVETQGAGMVGGLLDEVVLFNSLYYLWDMVLRVDAVNTTAGGVEVYLSLFDADDPEVDGTPPDTRVDVWRSGADGVALEWTATDDREGPLAFSYQLDGGGWSTWTDDAGAVITGVEPGAHTVEVTSRDAWLNEDPTPATVRFDLDSLPEQADARACGCGGSQAWLAWPLGLLGLRRRRRA